MVAFDPWVLPRSFDKAAYDFAEPYTHDPYLGSLLSGTPFIGQWLEAHEQSRRMNDYFENTGLSPNDVQYPLYTYGTQMGSYRYWAGIPSRALRYVGRKKKKRIRRKHSRYYYLRRYYARKHY